MGAMLEQKNNNFNLVIVIPVSLMFFFLYNYKPKSLINIIKETIFANYQNKQILEYDIFLISTILIYCLVFLFSQKYDSVNKFILFIVAHHLFDFYVGLGLSNYFQILYLLFLVSIFFNFSLLNKKINKININSWFNFLLVLLVVFFKTPPFTSGWAPSEWFKVARGYFGLFVGRSDNSAFITPNSPRTFFYDVFTGGIVEIFDLEYGYIIIKSTSILLVAYSIYRILNALELNLGQQILVLSIFVLNQDLIGGNEVIGIFEEDRFAVSFSLIALSYWLEQDFKKYSIFTLLSLFTHIQIGLFWFAFVSIYELIRKNKEYIKTLRLIILFSLPVVLPTGFEFLFGQDEIVYAFNKPSSWVYTFIFQAFHVAPFEVDGIVFNDFLLRNWATGFTNILVFTFVCTYLATKLSNSKLKFFMYFFITYFPLSIFLHFVDSKSSYPGKLASLFLFRFDTVFYLIILSILIKTLKNDLDISQILIFFVIVLTGLVNVNTSQAIKYNNFDNQIRKSEAILSQLDPEFILIEPNIELYTGSIELRTGIPTYISQKYITNSLSNFPEWYEKLELRGRFFQGECSLFFEMNLEYFIGRENNRIKCGDLLYPNGDYSIFKVPDKAGFNLPIFNSSCQFDIKEAEKILVQERENNNLSFEISIIYEDSPLDCSGKVIGTNLPQGAFVSKDVDELVLVADK
tara:strand:- start:802 stop:2865 length:2064 start_codon:yes stop_codon:yes gene_type:complete